MKDADGTGSQQFAISLAAGERPSGSPSAAGNIVFSAATTEIAASPRRDLARPLHSLIYAGMQAFTIAGGGGGSGAGKEDGGTSTPTAEKTPIR